LLGEYISGTAESRVAAASPVKHQEMIGGEARHDSSDWVSCTELILRDTLEHVVVHG
jgi:hypothetical protein